jgi:hypothetical protein
LFVSPNSIIDVDGLIGHLHQILIWNPTYVWVIANGCILSISKKEVKLRGKVINYKLLELSLKKCYKPAKRNYKLVRKRQLLSFFQSYELISFCHKLAYCQTNP